MTIQNLIALACSSHSEEEARTSALAACKAIKRNGVRLSLGPVPTEHPDPFQRGPAPPPKPSPPKSAPPPPPPPKPQPPKKTSKRAHHQNGDGPVHMSSKYEAWCRGCGGKVRPAERIWWKKGAGVCCEECGPSHFDGPG